MKNYLFLFLFLSLSLFVRGQDSLDIIHCTIMPSPEDSVGAPQPLTLCPNIDFSDYDITAPFTVYVNVHYYQDANGNEVNHEEGVAIAHEWIGKANYKLGNMTQNSKPGPNNIMSAPIPDTKYRYKLYTESQNTNDVYDGIWFHDFAWGNAPPGFNTPYNSNVIDIHVEGSGPCSNGRSASGQDVRVDGGPLICDLSDYNSHTFWSFVRLLNHEMAHSLSLQHVTYCNNVCRNIDINPELECDPVCPGLATCDGVNPTKIPCDTLFCDATCTQQGQLINICQWGVGNNITSQGGAANGITPCQWETVFNRIIGPQSSNPKYSWADNCTEQAPDLIIDESNVTWNTLKLLNRNVIVKTGSTLTIACEVKMSKKTQFIVERGARLILDGGSISNLCPETIWDGIVVNGNANKEQPGLYDVLEADDSGVLIVKNESLIEHAGTAISTVQKNVTSQQQQARRGALIHCENSTFSNNVRVAEFMKYSFENRSKFIKCVMDGGEEGRFGVTIWQTDGITFNECEIDNMAEYGILLYNAGVTVKDQNTFTDNEIAIQIFTTHPTAANIEIGDENSLPNIFTNSHKHIHSESSIFGGKISVVNNNFDDSFAAVSLIGPGNFNIDKNTINDSYVGIFTGRTGTLEFSPYNYIRDNTITDTNHGIYVHGNNSELQFLCNDFTCRRDFRLMSSSNSPGIIKQTQGGTAYPAGNCFTHPQITSDIFTLNQTNLFYYYVSSSPAICETPITPGNYLVSNSNGTGCQPYQLIGRPNHSDYVQIKKDLDKEIIGTVTYHNLMEQKNNIINYLILSYLDSDNITSVYNLLDEENTVSSKQMKYGIQLQQDDFLGAKQTLIDLPDNIVGISTLKQVQAINIKRLKVGSISQNDSLYLESIAQSDVPSTSSARAILSLLYGRKFDTILDAASLQSTEEEAVFEKSADHKISLSPNPARNEFTILAKGEIPATVKVVSLTGQVLYTSEITSKLTTVKISDWVRGLYLVQFLNKDGKLIQVEKVIIAK